MYIYIYIYTYLHIYIYIYIHTPTHTYIYICIPNIYPISYRILFVYRLSPLRLMPCKPHSKCSDPYLGKMKAGPGTGNPKSKALLKGLGLRVQDVMFRGH